ncbi:MAG: carboxypeptidase regulatory-like domain-containing protein [Deltaproteobacteria bacterium]|nr:carboxypeptidase regulatory-like domain-containing protein [Deltaproteobacteria bacterium]
MAKRLGTWVLGASAALAVMGASATALAEPTEPVVIGWWSYFDYQKVPTTTNAAHPVTAFGDPDTYYYEPSGGCGMQEDPNVLPADTAWNNMVSYVLSHSQNATLSSEFTRDESSDLNQFQEAYFGWAFVLLYVPKDKYCDHYQVHIGTVDDGVQAMANGKILGYASLGETDKTIDMVETGTSNLVLRPGINEVVLIHQDQCAVQRYVHGVYLTHNGAQIPLAPKSVIWGRVTQNDAAKTPLFEATVGLTGAKNDSFTTGPLGFYFFDTLTDGAWQLSAQAGGYKNQTSQASVALGQAQTEAVRVDFALEPGCNCPNGTQCGANGDCLEPCTQSGEFKYTCKNPGETCVNKWCVKDPCATMICNAGFACHDGVCLEIACSNVCCTAGQVCSAGQCKPDNCGAGCGPGQVCAGGTCVEACTTMTCVNGLACEDGKCRPECEIDPSKCGGPSDSGFAPDGLFADTGGPKVDAAGDAASPSYGGSHGGTATGDDGGCSCSAAGQSRAAPMSIVWLIGAWGAAQLRRRARRAIARSHKAVVK